MVSGTPEHVAGTHYEGSTMATIHFTHTISLHSAVALSLLTAHVLLRDQILTRV